MDKTNLTDEQFFAIANDYNHYEDYEDDYKENMPCDNSGYCSPECMQCK